MWLKNGLIFGPKSKIFKKDIFDLFSRFFAVAPVNTFPGGFLVNFSFILKCFLTPFESPSYTSVFLLKLYAKSVGFAESLVAFLA